MIGPAVIPGLALIPERFGTYSGTKAHILALSLRLQQELVGKGIRIHGKPFDA